jgi:hypothetical protein
MPDLERAEKVETNMQEKIVYWHRGLPPLAAEVMGEHTVEATSGRVPGTLAHRGELWNKCLDDLMAQVRAGCNRRFCVSEATTRTCSLNWSAASTTTQAQKPGYMVGSLTYSPAGSQRNAPHAAERGYYD